MSWLYRFQNKLFEFQFRVAARAVSELCSNDESPYGLILESPFNNVGDAIRNIPFSYIFPIPAFDWFFIEPLRANNLSFQSDVHIKNIDCPILILHAQDDFIIPIDLANKVLTCFGCLYANQLSF